MQTIYVCASGKKQKNVSLCTKELQVFSLARCAAAVLLEDCKGSASTMLVEVALVLAWVA